MNRRLFLAIWLCTLIWIVQQLQITRTIEQDIVAITKSTFNFITHFEGKKNTAYRDSKGLWTIGVGHLIKPDEQYLLHATLTDEQVEELFRSDLRWCDEAVSSSVRAPLNQNQYDALYSLCFNIGETNFRKSTVVKKINENDLKGAADAILMWNKPAVLQKRRERERALFLTSI